MRKSTIFASYLVCSLALATTPAAAVLKIKTKSNIKNDRFITPPPAGAVGCETGDTEITWTVEEPLASGRRNARPIVASDDHTVCIETETAINRVNSSNATLSRLQTIVDTCDDTGLRQLISDNGLSRLTADAAQFHAISTKGTGCNNGRAAKRTPPAVAGLVIAVGYDAATRKSYSIATWGSSDN